MVNMATCIMDAEISYMFVYEEWGTDLMVENGGHLTPQKRSVHNSGACLEKGVKLLI